MGIRENEDADIAAKTGLDVAITNMRFPVGDLSACVNQLCVKEWQQLWNQCTSNKLYSVQPVVGCSVSSSLGRYDSVLINRLRIGHTRLTNLISYWERVNLYVKLAILCSQSSTFW